LTLKSLAESGVFNLPNKTPLHSAGAADLYEAFTYLSAENALNDCKNEYQKQANKAK